MHVLATRGGVVLQPQSAHRHPPPGPAVEASRPSPAPAGYVERAEDARPLLGCYLAAVVHDLEHRWAGARVQHACMHACMVCAALATAWPWPTYFNVAKLSLSA